MPTYREAFAWHGQPCQAKLGIVNGEWVTSDSSGVSGSTLVNGYWNYDPFFDVDWSKHEDIADFEVSVAWPLPVFPAVATPVPTRPAIDDLLQDAKLDGDPLVLRLREALTAYTDKLKTIADEAIGEIFWRYEPYVESDFQLNVRTLAEQAVISFLKGDPVDLVKLDAYDMRAVRDAIWRDHREELIPLIDADRAKEIEELKQSISNLHELVGRDC